MHNYKTLRSYLLQKYLHANHNYVKLIYVFKIMSAKKTIYTHIYKFICQLKYIKLTVVFIRKTKMNFI